MTTIENDADLPEQPPIGGFCGDCGHLAARHNERGCPGVNSACQCRGMLWNGVRWPRPWLPAPEGLTAPEVLREGPRSRQVKQVTADELRPGDVVIGRVGSTFTVGPLTVARLTDNKRFGDRIGPRIYWREPIAVEVARSHWLYEVVVDDATTEAPEPAQYPNMLIGPPANFPTEGVPEREASGYQGTATTSRGRIDERLESLPAPGLDQWADRYSLDVPFLLSKVNMLEDKVDRLTMVCPHPRSERRYGTINQASEWCGVCEKVLDS